MCEAKDNLSVMLTATTNSVPGIIAECGGVCSCATCLVHVDASWFDKLPEAQTMEKEMLEFADHRLGNSRLSCQLKFNDGLDGLVVHVPESQN